jgi:outer membrane murein-binding lipoprotein Lpp
MKSLAQLIAILLGILGLSGKASAKKKAKVKKIDIKKKTIKKKVKKIDKELKAVKKKQTKAKKTVKRKPVKSTKAAEKFLKDFANKK